MGEDIVDDALPLAQLVETDCVDSTGRHLVARAAGLTPTAEGQARFYAFGTPASSATHAGVAV